MNITPRQLKIFVALAASLNFSRTASQLHITQPTLSKLLREIEETVGFRLFDRTTRSVSLTEDGAALLGTAVRMLEHYDQGIAEMSERAHRHAQRLSIAALPTLAAMFLPQAVARLQVSHPNAGIRIHDALSDEALRMLRAREVDMALTSLDPSSKDLVYQEILRDRFVLLVAKTKRLPRILAWTEALFTDLPIITMPRGSSTRRYIDAAILSDQTLLRPVHEFRDTSIIGRFVKAGLGVALLPQLGAELLLSPEMKIIQIEGAPELVEHDVEAVFALADRVSVLVYGKCIATGTPAEIRGNAAVREAYLGSNGSDA